MYKHAEFVMASNAEENGFALLERSHEAFGEAFYQFRLCHDLCIYTGNKELQMEIDQCAVDFRHMSLQTTTISDQVASVWCRTCLLFFENISQLKGEPAKFMKVISEQARDLSIGFKGVGNWCRELAGRIHGTSVQEKRKVDEYCYIVGRAKEEADERIRTLTTDLDKATADAKKQQKVANRWMIATMIPVVSFFAESGATIAAKCAFDAAKIEYSTKKKCEEAKAELEKATSDNDKAKV